jgi:hypothetical protein
MTWWASKNVFHLNGQLTVAILQMISQNIMETLDLCVELQPLLSIEQV